MKRFRLAALAASLAIAGGGLTAMAARQARTAGAFHAERPIDPAGSGPRRLAVDVPLLSAARPDLADLRLFGSSGEEIPYLFVRPPDPQPVWTAGGVLATPRTKTTSGFEADFGEPVMVDAIRVAGLPAPLLKRLSLEGSGDRAHWTVLLAEATLFDLPSDELRQLELAFAPGEYQYLRVTWNDTDSGRVPLPTVVFARRYTRSRPPRPELTAPLAVERRPSEPGISRYRLRLPAARLPVVALALEVENERVMRAASVTEPRLTGSTAVPVQIGRATLKRVVRDAAAAEALRIPLHRPMEAQLDLTVDDGSNPPLRLKSVKAVFETQPFVYFEAGAGPIVARYGDPRLEAPRYDLAAARDTIRIETVADAHWGEPRSITSEAAAAPAGGSIARGAAIDAAAFEVVRPIPRGEAALVSLELDAAALAHSAGPSRMFSDVRVIDASGRQVPYLLEQSVAPLVVDVALGPRAPADGEAPGATGGSVSEYEVTLPFSNLPEPRLVLTADARVFARGVVVGVHRPADRRHRDAWFEELRRAAWRHGDNGAPAPPLTLPLPPTDATRLAVRVEEGDNAPLPIAGARLLLPGYRLRFYRGASDALRLAYGRPDLEPPRYDIQLLAADVLGSAAIDVSPQEEPSRGPAAGTFVSPRLFWVVLGIAVVVLLGLVARLVSRA